jgi:hypothetical protein
MASDSDINCADLDVAGWADDAPRPHTGLLATELPLRPNLRLRQPEPLTERLALPPAQGGCAVLRSVVVANVLYAHARAPGTWVFYSRDRSYYARMGRLRRYVPPSFSLRNIVQAVEGLEQGALIEHRRTAPSSAARYRSRLRASPLLLSLAQGQRAQFVSEAQEVIVLRDGERRLVGYPETARTAAMRRDVLEHNAMLASLSVGVLHPDARYDANGFLRVRGQWLDPGRCASCRIFNSAWSCGGRWYGPFWQALPKDVRAGLRLNGEPVVELDFRGCHLRLLCAQFGLALPFRDAGFDPFAIPGFSRQGVKRAFHILVNADADRAAISALAKELRSESVAEPFIKAHRLVEAIREHFPGLERAWCTGIGVRLQCADADICARVQRRLRRRGVPILSIHDSFVVEARSAALLEEAMEDEMEQACRRAAERALI